jgi:hypothetical protein
MRAVCRVSRTTFTCKVCGLKTDDLTRPCPHWWNLLLGRLR